MMKGSQLKSFKDVNVGDWVWVKWYDDPYKLLPVRGKLAESIYVEAPGGQRFEITKPWECWRAIE